MCSLWDRSWGGRSCRSRACCGCGDAVRKAVLVKGSPRVRRFDFLQLLGGAVGRWRGEVDEKHTDSGPDLDGGASSCGGLIAALSGTNGKHEIPADSATLPHHRRGPHSVYKRRHC